MTYETAMHLIREACEKNVTKLNLSNNDLNHMPTKIKELTNLIELDLSFNQLDQLPQEITELKNLMVLILDYNHLNKLPPEIGELKNLKTLSLAENHLNQLPQEITKLKHLTTLILSGNHLTRLPPEITELESLKELDLCYNQLDQLPPEIGRLKDLTTLILSGNQLNQLPSEITELKSLTTLYLYGSKLDKLPAEIGGLKNLTTLYILESELNQLPPEIGGLKNLTTLILAGNYLNQLPPEIGKLENLTKLVVSAEIRETQLRKDNLDLNVNNSNLLPREITDLKNLTILELSGKQLTQLPLEITELKNIKELDLSYNHLTRLPIEITELKSLTKLELHGNPLISPPPEIASIGVKAIFTYLNQSKTTEINEAKLIIIGNGEVGKTCLAYRLVTDKFLGDSEITEGIKVLKWSVPSPDSDNSEIKLNIWDLGGQEIYHTTHQFFLTTRSVYILVWNARKTKDYDSIYYWLHTIEAFGGNSPIILVMSKMNEMDDDLNLKELKSKFPQIVDSIKIDSEDGKGISSLKQKIRETARELPLMKAKWVDSWFRVREKLEGLKDYWITYDDFYKICVSEGLDDKNIGTLDGYLHELGVTLHFKDRIELKNILILKPEWATGAFYKILSSKSIFREGVILHSELDQVWDKEKYSPNVYSSLMELMNKFELAYELPDKSSYLVPELLPKAAPNFEWNNKGNLCFYYCYNSLLPSGIIPRFIVRMHQNIEKKENGSLLCWREGVMLRLQNSCALIKMNHDEKQIEIRIKGDNKRGALRSICNEFDLINASIKKISVSKQIPCNCSDNCPGRYSYEKLLKAEINGIETIQCLESFKPISVSLLLDGYKRREERFTEFEYDVFISYSYKDKTIIEALIKDLKKEKITYWVDAEQIDYGDNITQRIEDGLKNSKYILACLSKNILDRTKSEYSSILNTEFGEGTEKIILLILDNCEDDDIPFLLRSKKRVIYSNKTNFNEFIKFLKSDM